MATLMQAGLYPIVSRDTGITLPKGCGMFLEEVTIDNIRELAREAHAQPREALERQMREVQNLVITNYSRSFCFPCRYGAFSPTPAWLNEVQDLRF